MTDCSGCIRLRRELEICHAGLDNLKKKLQKRSTEISSRFHSHVTWITQQLHGQVTRDYVYWMCLLKACEIEPPEGGAPYPYDILPDVAEIAGEKVEIDRLQPKPTSSRNNKEMMTACRGVEYWVFENHPEILPLPERDEW